MRIKPTRLQHLVRACFFLPIWLSLTMLAHSETGPVSQIEVGVAWQGESLMAERVLSGVRNALNDYAPHINLDIRKDLESLALLDSVITEFESTKEAMLIMRSNGVRLLSGRSPEIPAFFGAATNPVELSVAKSLEAPASNITGVTYYIPARHKLEVFQQIFPSMEKFLLLVEEGHPAADIDAVETMAAAENLGLSGRVVFCRTVEEAIRTVQEADIEEIIILGSQALLMDHASVIVEAAGEKPVYSYSQQPIEFGALAGFVADDIQLGYALGMMMIDVLIHDVPIETIPIQTDPDPRIRINPVSAEKFKDRIPTAILNLANTERLLESILESVPTGVGVVKNRVFMQVNDYITNLTGYTRDELIGQNTRMVYAKQEDYDYVQIEKYRQLYEHGYGRVNTRWQHKDGRILNVVLSSTPLNPDDLSAGVTFTVLNVTEQMQAEAALSTWSRLFRIITAFFMVILLVLVAWLSFELRQRKKMTRNLQKSNEKMATTLQSIGDGVIVTDEQGLVVNMNPVAETLTGWRLSDVKGKPMGESFHVVNARTRKRSNDPVQKVLKTGTVVELANHTTLISKKGTEYQISDSAAPIRDIEGNITGVVLVFSDVTEKYAQAEQLRKSEQRFRMLFENMTAGFALHEMIYDDKGTPVDYRYLELNPAFEKLTGVKADLLLGRTVKEALPGTESYWIDVYGKVAKTGEPVSYENYSKEVGKYFDVFAFSPAKDQFATIFVDITDKKKAEEKVKATINEMHVLKSALDEVPVCVFMKDLECRYVYANKATLDLFGFAEDEFMRKKDDLFFDSETTKKLQAIDKRVFEGKQTREETDTTDIHNHQRFYLEVKTPVYDKENPDKPIGLVGISTDITDQKRAESIIRQNLDEKNILLSEIHHRVKNNMAVICSLLSLETDFVDTEKDPKVLLQDTQNRIKSMAMVHELVYENKNFANIDLGKLLMRLADNLESIYDTDGKHISITVTADNVMLDLNKAIPLSLFANEVISNAFKHAFSGQQSGTIRVSLKREGEQCRFVIQDDGQGVRDVDALQNPESFGYTIMHGLVRQIRGKLDINSSSHGLRVEVQFESG